MTLGSHGCIIVFVYILSTTQYVLCQPHTPVVVAVHCMSPYVNCTPIPTGFSMEIWDLVAKKVGFSYVITVVADLPSMLQCIKSGQAG
jgi:hypothetical protein